MDKQQTTSVPEAAKLMGVTPMFLRIGLRNGKFPFGTAVKFRKRWSYYINTERFQKWMAGEDLAQGRGGALCECCGNSLEPHNGKVCDRCEKWAIQLLAETKKKALGQGLKKTTTPTPSLAR